MNTAKQVTVEQVENGFVVRKGDKSWVGQIYDLPELISEALKA